MSPVGDTAVGHKPIVESSYHAVFLGRQVPKTLAFALLNSAYVREPA